MGGNPFSRFATAVILCDFGETRLDDDLGLVYKRNLRIKILNENGYDWGTHSIYIYTGRYGERLNDLEAITYSLDENGEIIETELDDDNIFEEEISDTRTKYSFTMPALKPGCVVDIHYRINSESLWNIRDWTFQRDEPVLWSEYRIIYPKNISYAVVLNRTLEAPQLLELEKMRPAIITDGLSRMLPLCVTNHTLQLSAIILTELIYN